MIGDYSKKQLKNMQWRAVKNVGNLLEGLREGGFWLEYKANNYKTWTILCLLAT